MEGKGTTRRQVAHPLHLALSNNRSSIRRHVSRRLAASHPLRKTKPWQPVSIPGTHYPLPLVSASRMHAQTRPSPLQPPKSNPSSLLPFTHKTRFSFPRVRSPPANTQTYASPMPLYTIHSISPPAALRFSHSCSVYLS